MGKIRFKNNAEPETPSTGKTELYIDETSKTLKSKDDTGGVTEYLSSTIEGVYPSQEVHVSAGNGNDSTGIGTIARPYKTIKYAVSTITDSSVNKPYQVVVHSGTYSETNPIVIPTWTHILGVNEASVNIVSQNQLANTFEFSGQHFVKGISIVGPSGAAAIFCDGCDRLALVECFFISSLTAISTNQMAGGQTFVQNCSLIGCTTGIKSIGKELILSSLNVFSDCSTDVSITDVESTYISSTVNSSRNKIDLPDQYTRFFGNFNDATVGDEALVIYTELAVGRPELGRESVFGEGDSYTRGMFVYTYNASSAAYTNVTNNVTVPGDGNTATFSGLTVNNAIYVCTTIKDANAAIIAHLGQKMAVDTAQVGGEIVTEYWNGGSWVELHTMGVNSSGNYISYGVNYLQTSGSHQVRFNDMVEDTWVANDPMSLGVNYYWMRFRVNSTITTSPVFDQIKIHSNRLEVNADGYLEYFGKGRPIYTLPIIYGSFQAAGNSPANQDIFVSDKLDVGMIENSFQNGATDRTGMAFYVPLDMDTSCPLRFRISYIGTAASTATVDWTVRWGYTAPGDSIYTSEANAPTTGPNEKSIVRSTAMPSTDQTLQSEVFELDVASIITERTSAASGDILWISIERDGGGDAYAGNVAMVSVSPFYTSWREGGHINNWL